MSPAEVKASSVWELSVAVDGWVEANTPGDRMSANEADEVWAWMQTKESRVH
jgi:hypothetical protein